jgi:hypothetical protein
MTNKAQIIPHLSQEEIDRLRAEEMRVYKLRTFGEMLLAEKNRREASGSGSVNVSVEDPDDNPVIPPRSYQDRPEEFLRKLREGKIK